MLDTAQNCTLEASQIYALYSSHSFASCMPQLTRKSNNSAC